MATTMKTSFSTALAHVTSSGNNMLLAAGLAYPRHSIQSLTSGKQSCSGRPVMKLIAGVGKSTKWSCSGSSLGTGGHMVIISMQIYVCFGVEVFWALAGSVLYFGLWPLSLSTRFNQGLHASCCRPRVPPYPHHSIQALA